ncbi:peptidoglycan endopeptidase [Lactobacillus phage 3-SAC12]|nr:peptidoglycan endopeptidase [Lactobacillus phage 3-SAC12]
MAKKLTNSNRKQKYTVKDGETLLDVYTKFGNQTTVGAIMEANGLKKSAVKSGKTLEIPVTF